MLQDAGPGGSWLNVQVTSDIVLEDFVLGGDRPILVEKSITFHYAQAGYTYTWTLATRTVQHTKVIEYVICSF